MVLEAIYVVRHGFRMNWTVDPNTGEYFSTSPSPTGIKTDPVLAAKGVKQAEELAEKVVTLDPPIDAVYSSPFYRCLQTIKPSVEKLIENGRIDKVRVENGFGEYFGTAHFNHPGPAPVNELQELFTFIDGDYAPVIRPNISGETLLALQDRNAYALHEVISQLDNDPSQPKALLICSHAASIICIGRALTGFMPDDVNTDDFRCGVCSLSKYVRRKMASKSEAPVVKWKPNAPASIPRLDWRGGRGVAGGWDCVWNGDCSFLAGGEERSWHFNGDETFLDIDEPHVSKDFDEYDYAVMKNRRLEGKSKI